VQVLIRNAFPQSVTQAFQDETDEAHATREATKQTTDTRRDEILTSINAAREFDMEVDTTDDEDDEDVRAILILLAPLTPLTPLTRCTTSLTPLTTLTTRVVYCHPFYLPYILYYKYFN